CLHRGPPSVGGYLTPIAGRQCPSFSFLLPPSSFLLPPSSLHLLRRKRQRGTGSETTVHDFSAHRLALEQRGGEALERRAVGEQQRGAVTLQPLRDLARLGYRLGKVG